MAQPARGLILLRFPPTGGATWSLSTYAFQSPQHLGLCQPIKPKPLPSVERRWRELGDEALAVSAIGEAELLYGIEWKQSVRLAAQYDHLLKNRLQVLSVDTAVARSFSQIKTTCRKKGFLASDFDFLIAATAKVHGLVLATLNFSHFNAIEGLAVEDWSRG